MSAAMCVSVLFRCVDDNVINSYFQPAATCIRIGVLPSLIEYQASRPRYRRKVYSLDCKLITAARHSNGIIEPCPESQCFIDNRQ